MVLGSTSVTGDPLSTTKSIAGVLSIETGSAITAFDTDPLIAPPVVGPPPPPHARESAPSATAATTALRASICGETKLGARPLKGVRRRRTSTHRFHAFSS